MKNPYGIDWTNIDLNSEYERSLNIIDPLSFADLLVEVHCNIKYINEETIRQQFETDLQNRTHCAREVFEHNLKNLVKCAEDYRKD
jgi:hypothetical protein